MHRGRAWHLLVVWCALVMAAGCGEDEKRIPGWDGGQLADSGVKIDIIETDLGTVPDGLPSDPGGPTILIQSPKQNETVIGSTLKVLAKVTDADGVDDPSVKVQIQGTQATQMSVTADPTVYEALLDISSFTSNIRLWVVAADQKGNKSSKVVEFKRDPGPVIVFFSPVKDSRWRSSVTVKVLVSGKNLDKDKVQVRLGSKVLALTMDTSVKDKIGLTGTVKFDDFSPALTGNQVLEAEATNTNGAKSAAKQPFVVDDVGPTISITSQSAGDLIGGIIKITATVSDLAGVLTSSVVAVIGNNLSLRQVQLVASSSAASSFEGVFDTRTLDQYDIWPVISVRAADKLGNEAHQDIQVGLDNGSPVLELDPPHDFHLVREQANAAGVLVDQCSRPFDPLGPYAANDRDRVPQIYDLRVQVEDQGNWAPSAKWVPYATVDKSSVWLYVLDDTTQPLVVDTDGDGYCDDINPKVIPVGSKPVKGEAVAVALAPIAPTGAADFTPPASTTLVHPGYCDSWGDDPSSSAPKPLCLPGGSATVVVPDASPSGSEPAIYSIPPIKAGGANTFGCLGLPFDFKANAIDNGWVCVAAVATDKLTNRGVSRPLRVYVDKAWVSKISAPVTGVSAPPDCTGTMDKSGAVTSTPCKWRNPRVNAPASCTDNNQCEDCSVLANTSTQFPQMFPHCRGLRK